MGRRVYKDPTPLSERGERGSSRVLALGGGLHQLDSIPRPGRRDRMAAALHMMCEAPDLIEVLGLDVEHQTWNAYFDGLEAE